MLALLEQKGMPKDSPILVRIFKEESELEVWKQDTTGHFQLLKVYPICRWSGDLGPKVKEGDRQAPEGFYTITPALMNPNSNYYLAINTGFPNAFDRANDRHGAFLMIHGDCSSRGCYAMTDEQIGEIYSLAREVLPRRPAIVPDPGLSVPHDAGESRAPSHQSEHGLLEDDQGRQRPFRGDASRAEGRRLRPALCVRRRSRRRIPPGRSSSIRPAAARPSWWRRRSPERRWTKQRNDEAQFAQLVRSNSPVAPIRTGLDGGSNSVFLAQTGPIPPARVPPPGGTAVPEIPPQPARPRAASSAACSRRNPPPRRRASPRPIRNRRSSTSAASSAGCSRRTAPARSRRPRRRLEAPPRKSPPLRPPQGRSRRAKSRNLRSASPSRSKPMLRSRPQPQPQQQEANAYAPAPAKNGNLLQGAQPVVPAGNFDSRFGGLQ